MTLRGDPIYDPDFHPDDCIRLGLSGKFAVQMARDWGVHTDTIQDWKAKHPTFAVAYKKSQNYRTAWLLDKGSDNLVSNKQNQLNAVAWSMIMRYDGQNTDERTMRLKGISKCKTATEKFACLMKAFEKGDVTPKEAQTLSDVFTKEMNATDVVAIKADLKRLQDAFNTGA